MYFSAHGSYLERNKLEGVLSWLTRYKEHGGAGGYLHSPPLSPPASSGLVLARWRSWITVNIDGGRRLWGSGKVSVSVADWLTYTRDTDYFQPQRSSLLRVYSLSTHLHGFYYSSGRCGEAGLRPFLTRSTVKQSVTRADLRREPSKTI